MQNNIRPFIPEADSPNTRLAQEPVNVTAFLHPITNL